MKLQAQDIRKGDFLVRDRTVTDAKPAEVLDVVQNATIVTITYLDRQGKPAKGDYSVGEFLEVVEEPGENK